MEAWPSAWRLDCWRTIHASIRHTPGVRPTGSQGVLCLSSESLFPSIDGLDVRLDLIAHYRQSDGTVVAIAARPESLASDERSLNWSDQAESERSSLAQLEHLRPGPTAYVYSERIGGSTSTSGVRTRSRCRRLPRARLAAVGDGAREFQYGRDEVTV